MAEEIITTNMNRQIDQFIKGTITPLPEGAVTITNTKRHPNRLENFVNYIKNNFDDENVITIDAFNFTQDVIEKISPLVTVKVISKGKTTDQKLDDVLGTILAHECKTYINTRPDLLPYIRSFIVDVN